MDTKTTFKVTAQIDFDTFLVEEIISETEYREYMVSEDELNEVAKTNEVVWC